MRCLIVLTFVLTYASTQSHGGGHSVVPKKGGFSHDNPEPDAGRSWAHQAYNDKKEVADEEQPEETIACVDYFQPHADSIVRTKDSLKAGAVFLSAPNPVSDVDECMGWCQCDSEDEDLKCDMVVFESNKKNCYLFHCIIDGENKCLFAHHQGYTSMVFDEKSFAKDKEVASHAQELQGLVDDDPTEAPDVTTKKTITTPAQTTTEKRNYGNPWYYYNTGGGDGNQEDSEVSEYRDFNNEDHGDDGRYEYDRPGDDSQEEMIKTTVPPKPKPHYKEKVDSTTFEEATKPAKVEAQTEASEKATQPVPRSTPSAKKSNPVTEKPDQKNGTTLHEEGGVEVEEIYTKSGRTVPETSAILPLAIGLAITLLLLLMVACRLRMVKRKLRYGRPLHNSQEADYLINGMYL